MMTTIIDWKEAPYDATHAGIDSDNDIYWYKNIAFNSYEFLYDDEVDFILEWDSNEGQPVCKPLIKRPAKPEIDLKTLNVTFGELDRETKLRLAEHVIGGGKVNYCVNGTSWGVGGDELHFVSNIKYRAAWTERDTMEADIKAKLSELQELYNDLINLQDKE